MLLWLFCERFSNSRKLPVDVLRGHSEITSASMHFSSMTSGFFLLFQMKYLIVCLLFSLLVAVISAKPDSAPTAINAAPGKGLLITDVIFLRSGYHYINIVDHRWVNSLFDFQCVSETYSYSECLKTEHPKSELHLYPNIFFKKFSFRMIFNIQNPN